MIVVRWNLVVCCSNYCRCPLNYFRSNPCVCQRHNISDGPVNFKSNLTSLWSALTSVTDAFRFHVDVKGSQYVTVAVLSWHGHPSRIWRVNIFRSPATSCHRFCDEHDEVFTISIFIPGWLVRLVLWLHVHWKWSRLGCSHLLALVLHAMIMCLGLHLKTVAVAAWHVRQSRRCSDDDITPWAALVADTPAHKY